MIRSVLGRLSILAATLALSTMAHAQYANHGSSGQGWEGGFDVVYQNATTLDFDGGSKVNTNTDWGLALTFGYRFSTHLEVLFGLDWADVDYRANFVLQTGGITQATGSYQAFTPRINVQYTLLDRPISPFAMAGIGYTFVDTNIPNGRPSTGCWWDPWYGYVCTTVQSTKTVDGFAYQAGLGVRWDVSDTSSFRLFWERNWADLGHGSPSIDQIRLGYTYRYNY
jgi:opacity protein-like surface antigen